MKYLRQGRSDSHMTEERIKLLDALNFEWNVNQTFESDARGNATEESY